ncbi:MAG: ATP-dependent sacrificial sulfur transferase LarE [Candidatus Methanomethylicota archaeon]|uniref:ATP-dependent sacrificial sulfur transferase LarE n=1 Tax=Thermoproteota archaeon TaxID=2056631 RepID=A0A497EVF3_9CREN|nr:MAG: ATP-dependent sacrificial sulfur transferase LarE [Candidatus Verstraetearchaeota archaeon]
MANEKFNRLINWFKDWDNVLIAFSGGMDSSLITYIAKKVLGNNVLAVTVNSPLLSIGELNRARRIANIIGVRHLVLDLNLLENERIIENSPNRCYYCKLEFMGKLLEIAKFFGFNVVVDGTNIDDMKSYRPGIKALRELGIRSPLAEVGLSKADIRNISRKLNLPTMDMSSTTCLATRIPYGVKLNLEVLRRVNMAELIVKQLTGISLVRVRDHGFIARIEVDRNERRKLFNEQVLDEISRRLKKLGYLYVTMELEGYTSGSMDRLILSGNTKHKLETLIKFR